MKIIYILFVLLLLSVDLFAEETLEPDISYIVDISPGGKEELKRGMELFDSGPNISETDKLVQKKYDNFLESSSGFEFGCSWYCGGTIQEINSSSKLSSTGKITYSAKNAHDFNLDTAWVEGKKGYGIGEYIEYKFAANSPRVTKIYIYNGYMKSKAAWEDNSRVKKIKLHFDNKPYKVLNLKDNTGIQVFNIGTPFQSSTHPAYSLKFIIAEVYPGKKYKDVAISEISLSGIDVHCVNKGSQILLASGKVTNIEDIKIGDRILAYNKDKDRYIPIIVNKVKSVAHETLYRIKTNSSLLEISSDHPILTENNELIIINKNDNIKDLLDKKIAIYTKGKISFEQINSIDEIHGSFKTYTLIVNSHESLFFIANDVLITTEK